MTFSFSLSHLNENQKKAVENIYSNALIVAGAGTGKTRVIIDRMLYLLSKEVCSPENILAITFTKKAALEVQERIDVALPYGYFSPNIETFHALAEKILRSHAHFIGLDPSFKLLSKSEEYLFFKSHIFEFSLKRFRPYGSPNKFIYFLLDYFSKLSDENISIENFSNWALENGDDEYIELTHVYEEYTNLKRKEGIMSFADLMTNCYELLNKSKQALKFYRDSYRYIMVDEFQDTNYIQSLLLYKLAGEEDDPDKSNLFVVGDDSQSIYRFRGAAVSNILNFKNKYTKADTIVLNTNYRSYQEILDKSYSLIKNNDPHTLEYKDGISKKLVSQRTLDNPEDREKRVVYTKYQNSIEESDNIVQKILEFNSKGVMFKDMAILIRSHDQSPNIITSLEKSNIGYVLGRGDALLENEIVKDLNSYVYILLNNNDDVNFYRFLNSSLLNFPKKDLWEILSCCEDLKLSYYSFISELVREYDLYIESNLENIQEDANLKDDDPVEHIFKKDLGKLGKRFVFLSRYNLNLSSIGRMKVVFEQICQDSDNIFKYGQIDVILSNLVKQNSSQNFLEENSEILEKIFILLNQLKEKFPNLSARDYINFLEGVGGGSETLEEDFINQDKVKILTVHASKGLEFGIVFIPSLTNGKFPSKDRSEVLNIPMELSSDNIPLKTAKLEEERRLFYVALTRAKDYVFLSSADFYSGRVQKKKISQFIYEIFPEKHIDKSIVKEDKSRNVIEGRKEDELYQPELIPSYDLLDNVLSYSQIDCYDTCPYKYYYRYVLKVPTEISSEFSFGTVIHNSLSEFYKKVMQGEKPNVEDLINIYHSKWINRGYESDAHRIARKKFGEETLRNNFDFIYTGEENPVMIEEKFETKIEGVRVVGRIDRIDREGEGYRLIDYKTGEAKKQAEVNKNLQLTIYSLAASEVLGNFPITTELFFVEKGVSLKKKEKEKNIEELSMKILTVLNGLRNKDFHPNPGFHCNFCEFRNICQFANKLV